MEENLLNIEIPNNDNKSIIKVIGVGGGGSNAVNYMYRQGIKDVSFVVCNTDSQALLESPVPTKIQIGENLTDGRGAGNMPEQGKKSAEENLETIETILKINTKMVFITAGMGGGTGTGAAPVIAKAAKALNILTVGIVTIPFRFEGKRRIDQAIEGINKIKDHVDSLLVINNEKLREIHGNLKISEAFSKADNVLTIAAKGIAEIITVHGYINVDFADVQTVMKKSGVAIMGSAMSEGDGRALRAIKEALNSPLLNNNNIKGAKNILLNITSGSNEVTMDEIGEITEFVQDSAGSHANLIWGNGIDESLGEKINITIIATGFSSDVIPEIYAKKEQVKTVHSLDGTVQNGVPKKKVTETNTFDLEVEDSFYSTEKKSDADINPQSANHMQDRRLSDNQSFNAKTVYKTNIDIEFLENTPAYKRKNIDIGDFSKSSKSEASQFMISDNPKNGFSRNAYLEDNVD